MGTIQECWEVPEASPGVLDHQAERSGGSSEGSKNSFKEVDEAAIRSTDKAFFRSSRRSSSSTSSRPLSNIFCSFSLRNFFYWRRRFSLDCWVRASSLAASQAASAFTSSFFKRSKALLMLSKLTTGSAGSHRFPVRTYSLYFRDKEDKRHSF